LEDTIAAAAAAAAAAGSVFAADFSQVIRLLLGMVV
jgi:hypothetical protein